MNKRILGMLERDLAKAHDSNVIVVGCHPDDESIAMGGTLNLLAPICSTNIVVLTNGAGNQRGAQRDEIILRRQQELRSVAQILHLSGVSFLDNEDGFLEYHQERTVRMLADLLMALHPHTVFTHSRHDSHPDHAVAFGIVQRACWLANRSNLKSDNLISRIFEFEILTPLREYTELVDISSVVDEKRRLLMTYESQAINVEAMIGLNRFRAAHNTVPPFQGTHFEAFFETKTSLL